MCTIMYVPKKDEGPEESFASLTELERGNEGGEPEPEVVSVTIEPDANPVYSIGFRSVSNEDRLRLVDHCRLNGIVYREYPMKDRIDLEVLPGGELPDWLSIPPLKDE